MSNVVWTNFLATGNWNDSVTWALPGVPGSGDDVFFSVPGLIGPYLVNINAPEAAKSLTISTANATLSVDSTLTLTNDLTLSAGTFQLDNAGTVQGGTFKSTGGSFVWDGGTLSGVTYWGVLTLSAASVTLQISNGLTLKDATGTSDGLINLTGSNSYLYVTGTQTLDHATINIGDNVGTGAHLVATGPSLTLGSHLTLEHTGKSVSLANSGNGIIVNNGEIEAEVNLGGVTVAGTAFTNTGTITVSGGDTIYLDATTEINSGTLAIGSNGTAYIDSASGWTDSGTITLASSGALNIAHNFTLDQAGTIDNQGYIFLNSNAHLNLAGTITGQIVDNGASIVFNDGTLDGVTYTGTLDLSSAQATVTIDHSLLVHTANAAPGTIVDTGYQSVLNFHDTQAFGSGTVQIGNAQVDSILKVTGTNATLTLYSDLTIEQVNANAQITGDAGDTIVNYGAIDALVAGLGFTINPDYFTNYGTITVSDGADLEIHAGSLFNGTGEVDISGASTLELGGTVEQDIVFVGTGGTLQLDNPAGYSGTIAGFDVGDTIDLEINNATGATLVNATSTGATLRVSLVSGGPLDFTLSGDYTGDTATGTIVGNTFSIGLSTGGQSPPPPPPSPPTLSPVTDTSSLATVPGSLGYEFGLLGGASGTLTLGIDNANFSSPPLSLGSSTTTTIDTNGYGDTISSVLSGSGGLAKAGAGILVLTGINSYIGGTEIVAGTLEGFAANSNTGGSLANAIEIDTNAVLAFETDSSNVTHFTGALSGQGGLFVTDGPNGAGEIDFDALNGFSDTHTGGTTVTGGATLVGSAGGGSGGIGIDIVNGTVDVHSGNLETGTDFTISGGSHLEIDSSQFFAVGDLTLSLGATIQIDNSAFDASDLLNVDWDPGTNQEFDVTHSGGNTLVTVGVLQSPPPPPASPPTTIVSLGTDAGTVGELRSAIADALSTSASSVTFSSGFTSHILLANALPTINTGVGLDIDGTGAGAITIDGSSTQNHELVELGTGATLTFTDIAEIDGDIETNGGGSVVFEVTSGTSIFSGDTDLQVTLNKDGAGTLLIQSGSEINGNVLIATGTLEALGGDDNLNDGGSLLGPVTIENGATLQLDPQDHDPNNATAIFTDVVFDNGNTANPVGTLHVVTHASSGNGRFVYADGDISGDGTLSVDGGGTLYLDGDIHAFTGTLEIGTNSTIDTTGATVSASLQAELQAAGAELVIDALTLETPGGQTANRHLTLSNFANGASIKLTNLDFGGDVSGATVTVSNDGAQIVIDLHDSQVQGFPDDFVTIDGSIGLFSAVSVQGDAHGNVVITSNTTTPPHINMTAAALAGGTSNAPLAITLGGNAGTEVNLPGGVPLDLTYVQFNTGASTTPVVLFDTVGSAHVTLPGLLPSNGKPLEFAATSGNNSIVGGAAPVEIFGGTDPNGHDTIVAGSGGGSLVGGAGTATIDAGTASATDWNIGGAATVWGAFGGGSLFGGGDHSMLISRGNNTTMTASTTALHQMFQGDTVGGAGAHDIVNLSQVVGAQDILVAGTGNTTVQLFASNDLIMGGSGALTITGGTSSENLIYLGSTSTSESTSIAGGAEATIYARGGDGHDTLSASFGGSSTLVGGMGNTTFVGAAGNGLMISQGAAGAHDSFQFADQATTLGGSAGSFVVGGFTASNDTLQITYLASGDAATILASQHIVTLTASDTSHAPLIGQSALQIVLTDGEKIDIVGMTAITAANLTQLL